LTGITSHFYRKKSNIFLLRVSLISVGGDGLFSEVFTSLLNRTQNDNNINQNDFDATLVEPTKTIGIIPAGKIFLF
jgi:hypothetical protein